MNVMRLKISVSMKMSNSDLSIMLDLVNLSFSVGELYITINAR